MSGGREVRAGGTRRRFVVGVMGVTVSALALAAMPAGSAFGSATAAPSAQCQAEELERPNGTHDVAVVDGDPTGRYIVGWQGLLWTDGAVEELTGPADNPEYPVDLAAVNSSGVVVGNTTVGNDSTDPWTYQSRTYSDLRNDGAGDWANGVNAGGDVVGFAWSGTDYIPQIWRAGDYENPRPLLAAEGAEPHAISDSGVAVDIAGDWAVGYSPDGGLRWNLRDGSVEELPGSIYTVNSSGDAAGAGETLYRADGSAIELPSPGDEGGVEAVSVVFERGGKHTAAGTFQRRSQGVNRPVLWTC